MSRTLKNWAMCLLACAAIGHGQSSNQVGLRIEPTNRTLALNAEERVTVDPELAILHVGFETQPMDAKAAYAEGARISNAVIAAIKGAGIEETAIRSESQSLERDWSKPHRFKLVQQWTVKTPPGRASEILDIAVTAGATESGQIEWTVADPKQLEAQALQKAAARVREQASALSSGMGVKLGPVLYISNEVKANPVPFSSGVANDSLEAYKGRQLAALPLAIEPRKVARTAAVYAVFAIE